MTTPTKNPAAVALGRIRSERKAAAARRNGSLGGKPKSRYQLAVNRSASPPIWRVVEWRPGQLLTRGGYATRIEAVRMLKALRERERAQSTRTSEPAPR